MTVLRALLLLLMIPVAARVTAQPAPAQLESGAEALAEDASVYARRYDVPLAEAFRRLGAQQASVTAVDALAATYRDRLAGLVLEHCPDLRLVALLTGDAAPPDTIAGTIPVTFRIGAAATREQLLAAIEAHQAELAAAFADPPGIGLDERRGAIAVLVRTGDVGDDATAARLSALAGVPVEVLPWNANAADLAVEGQDETAPPAALPVIPGGSRVVGLDPERGRRFVCTSGFAVGDGTRTAIVTAAHCPDTLALTAPGGAETPLTMVEAWGARTQDVQVHVASDPAAPPFAPLFYADAARTRARALTSWRNRASTRVGDFVCHRGERTGASCAEVAFASFAPPGALCAGPCPATWVAVRGPDCRGGDSGGPVFAGTIAFGLVKGASYTADGTCRLYYYMSIDYLPAGWRLLYLGAGAP